MGFFDSLKENANALKEKATDLAQTGVAESKRLAEIAKLKAANMAEEDAIKKAYVELGKLYYEQMSAQPGEDYAPACEKITAARANIEANNDRIAELKVKEDEAEEEPEIVAEVEAVVADVAEAVEDVVEEVVEEVKEAVEEVTEADFDEEPKPQA